MQAEEAWRSGKLSWSSAKAHLRGCIRGLITRLNCPLSAALWQERKCWSEKEHFSVSLTAHPKAAAEKFQRREQVTTTEVLSVVRENSARLVHYILLRLYNDNLIWSLHYLFSFFIAPDACTQCDHVNCLCEFSRMQLHRNRPGWEKWMRRDPEHWFGNAGFCCSGGATPQRK